MTPRVVFAALFLVHCLMLPSFSEFMGRRPVEVKLGYVPHPQVVKLTLADQRLLAAELMIVKVLFYYGTLVEKFSEKVIIKPEQANMFRTLLTAVQLDPYNMDAYYFAQASFTWEVGRIAEVNELLEWGMQHRKWDPWLPFYIGFNHAYFLKNYELAAEYLQKAAEISGNPLFANLAARYFYESSQTELGLVFLENMIKSAKDKAVRQTYQLRRDSLQAVQKIEKAIEKYKRETGDQPLMIDALIRSGLLQAVPIDPYGGEFYLDDNGRVRTTSKLAPMDRE